MAIPADGAVPAPERLDGVHQGAGWFLSWVDGVEVVYLDGRMTPHSLDAYLACLEHLMQTARTPRACYYDVPEPTVLDAAARRRISDLLERYRTGIKRMTLAWALVTPSATVRGILRTVYWMSPPPYPYSVFRTDLEAWQWLALYTPIDATAALDRFRRLKRRLMPTLDGGVREPSSHQQGFPGSRPRAP